MAKKFSAADRKRIQRKAALARARRAFLKRQAQEADEPEEKKEEEEPDMEAKKRECARLRRRVKALRKRAQEIEDGVAEEPEKAPEEPKDEEVEARKRLQARRKAAIKAAAKRRAMKKKAQEAEEIPADIEPEPEEEEKEEVLDEMEARKAAARRARALRRARRAMRRKAEADVSDDLTGPADDGAVTIPQGKDVSDDLATPDEGDGGIQQTPAELPDSIDEAEDKVLAAYNLIEAQIARKVIPANVKKAALASKYAKAYTAAQMKFAAENLSKVGSVEKSASKSVRVSKRPSMPYTKSAAKKGGSMDDYCLFG